MLQNISRSVTLFFTLLLVFTAIAQETRELVVVFKDTTSGSPVYAPPFTVSDSSTLIFSGTSNRQYHVNVPLPQTIRLPFYLSIKGKEYENITIQINTIEDTATIQLTPSLHYKSLQEVKVSTVQKIVKEDARGAELDMSKIKDAHRITVAEALQRIPGVAVDEISGNITYMGKEVAIVKDGINVAGFADLVKSTLNANRANTYEKISINLYDLKTEQPTISFDVSKFENGISGNITGTATTESSSLSMPVTIVYKKHLMSIGPRYSNSYFPGTETERNTTYLNTGRNIQEFVKQNTSNGARYNLSFSDNLSLSKYDIIDISADYGFSSATSGTHTRSRTFNNGMMLGETNVVSLDKKPGRNNDDFIANFAYIHKFKPRERSTSRYDVMVNYIHNGSENSSNMLMSSTSENNISEQNNIEVLRKAKFNYLYSSVDYELKHTVLGNFEAVVKYFKRSTNDFSLTSFKHTNSDSSYSQEFELDYHYTAALVSWDKAFKPFSVRIVLKQDYSLDRILKGSEHNRQFRFGTFAPYISLHKPFKQKSLRLEAQYIPTRPEIQTLSTLSNYGGQYSSSGYLRKGNPNLKPSKAYNLMLQYSAPLKNIGIQTDISYRKDKDLISSYKMIQNDITVSTYRNIDTRHSLTGTFRLMIIPIIRTTVMLSGLYTGSLYKQADTATQYTNNYNFVANITYKATPRVSFSVKNNYSSLQEFQVKTRSIFSSGIGMTYSYDKLLFTFGADNFFKPYNTKYTFTETESLLRESYTRNRQLRFSLTFTYRLLKPFKQRPKEQGKAIIADDM